jgi:steroid delta-isomerase-like uncharacterized protein
MQTDDKTLIVRRFFEDVCNGRKLDVADTLFAPDHTYHDPSDPAIGPGPEGMKALMALYQRGFPDAHWAVHDMLVSGDTVVTRWTGSGTQKAEVKGIPATGKRVSVDGIWIHRLSGGLIRESWNVWDTLGMLQQLGVVPSLAAQSA